jgi:hypothetical protein
MPGLSPPEPCRPAPLLEQLSSSHCIFLKAALSPLPALQMLDLSPVDPYGFTRQVVLQQAAPDLTPSDVEALSILTKMLTLRPVGAVASHAVGGVGAKVVIG